MTRRFTVPARTGGLPLAIAYAPTTDPMRILVRNEGTGGPEAEGSVIPAPLNPFNMPAGPPLTFPFTTEQPCLLHTEYNELIYSPDAAYVLTDGGADIFVLAPGQALFALSATNNKAIISVEVITGLIAGDVYYLDVYPAAD